MDDIAAIRDQKIAAANAARDAAVQAAQLVRDEEVAAARATYDAVIEGAESTRDAQIAAAEQARDASIAAAEAMRDAAVKAAEAAREAWLDAAHGMVEAVSGISETISSELASIDTDIVIKVHTVYSEEGVRPNLELPGEGPTTGPTTAGPVIDAHTGTGGIHDWGPMGQPARLHGREAVMTEDAIMRMVAAAASGGRNTEPDDRVIEMDGEVVGRLVSRRVGKLARGRGYRR